MTACPLCGGPMSCPLCGSDDLRPLLSGWHCDNCGALTAHGKEIPSALPDEREQAREHALMAAEDAARLRDSDATELHERREGGKL